VRTWGQWFLDIQPAFTGNASRLVGLGDLDPTVGSMGNQRCWKRLAWERRTLLVRERPEVSPRLRERSRAAAAKIRSKVAKATF